MHNLQCVLGGQGVWAVLRPRDPPGSVCRLIFDAPNSTAFVHVTTQDTLAGLARVQLDSQRKSFRTIPDSTVRVTRFYGDQGKKVHRMALSSKPNGWWDCMDTVRAPLNVIHQRCNAKSMSGIPWNTKEAKVKAGDILPRHIPQLMFQAYYAWQEFPDQQCLYVGILIGPYLTAMVFNSPPTLLGHRPLPASHASPLTMTQMTTNSSLQGIYLPHICDVFPHERAPI